MRDDTSENSASTDSGGLNAGELFARARETARTSDDRTHPWTPPTCEELQRGLPQYEVLAMIGRGGMGAVYRCRQKSLDRDVAIKVLPADANRFDADFAVRFKREGKAMARLTHPGIIAIHDAGETADGLLYFVMEFVEGASVAKLLAAEGHLPARRAVEIALRVCDALAYAHGCGIVHRDIKPSNLMLDETGAVKIADFGLVKFTSTAGDDLTETNMAVGTPDFAAPETLRHTTPIDGRADLYSLGATLYQMLTGMVPRGRFEPASGTIPQVDPRLDAIVDRAMQADREKRFANAEEMRRALEQVVSGRRHPSTLNGNTFHRMGIAFALLVLAACAYFLMHARGGKAAAGSTTQPGAKWTKAFAELARLPGVHQSENGWVRFRSDVPGLRVPGRDGSDLVLANGGVSARFRGVHPGIPRWAKLQVRLDGTKAILAMRYLPPGTAGDAAELRIELEIDGGRNFITLASAPAEHPLREDEEYTMEFYAVGQKLIGRLNRQTLAATITQEEVPVRGALGIWGTDRNWFRDLEVIDFDGLSEAEALKLVATPVR